MNAAATAQAMTAQVQGPNRFQARMQIGLGSMGEAGFLQTHNVLPGRSSSTSYETRLI